MKFHTIHSLEDAYYQKAVEFYNKQLDVDFFEDSIITKRSLQNNKTENDYVLIVGIEKENIISLATAHYEATTNSAFLVHLLAVVDSNYDEIISQTLNEVETHLNILSNKVHARDINFLMIEVPKLDNSILDNQLIKRRHHTLLENDFEQQYDIDYLHPNYTFEETPIRTDLFIKSNIELTKDIYPASVKSNYILKYVFANGISRDIIYPLLEKMNLRLP
ncbi:MULTISPECIES: hypothetical protein [Staphylococcus]|jgi:hypothetical protein|uniref:Uncharacterized protein n=2 Tax=Bacillales TaxID=1385 RepID=A0A3S7GUV0_STAHO|nr:MULTISPECIES: hypothetical protein [Staphylococcus]EUZ68173.1 hypothetical protein O552_01504 [Staphylococcus sp. M0480]OFM78240.1 hypothetical protein HMPREF2662_08055 [Staphylococcus sp. HMSC074B09]OFS51116.1 hypothetical protein HMPREF2873_08030 [Staphylococcus sp. HMSC075H09]OHO57915.1 hypothetical protein HMPREF2650_10275 [Staphylococcus sp. HMSC035F02]AUW63691.1 hypothetical protein AL495_09690 [Staphylococcus hominis]